MSKVLSVSRSSIHCFSKEIVQSIVLVQGEGVEGDAHKGKTVKHRSRVKADPTQPNLRQVHLIHNELICELQSQGFKVKPASMGENITTVGIKLLDLPTGTILKIGKDTEIEITGLRNPCAQLDNYQMGLTAAVLEKGFEGEVIRKAGVMGIIIKSGEVFAHDKIKITLPNKPYKLLVKV